MGVYLPNMEMPTSCEECPLGDSLHCQVLPSVPALWAEYTNAIREKRPHSDCPLVPVPPHGDLIDRSVLYKKTAEWEEQARHLANAAPDARTFDKWETILTERSAFKFDVADAPTIIPAEEIIKEATNDQNNS